MGGVTAPAGGVGSLPTWIAFVAKRIRIAVRGSCGPPVKCFASFGDPRSPQGDPPARVPDPATNRGSGATREVPDDIDARDDPLEAVLLADDDRRGPAQEELVH